MNNGNREMASPPGPTGASGDASRRRFLERLSGFALAAAALESGDHGGASLRQVQLAGETLARDLAAHIALEESQLDGFL